MNSKLSGLRRRIQLFVYSIPVRIYGLILLALLGLVTTLSVPSLSAQPVIRTSTITQTSSAQSLLQQGIELYEAERFSQAAATWQQASSAFAVSGNHLGQALALSNLSLTHQQLGQWEEAQKYISQSLNLLQASEDTANSQTHLEILAKALNTQGNLQWEKGQLEAALSTWKQATRDYAFLAHGEGVVLTKINQSKALQALGLSRRAVEILQEVYQHLRQQPNSELKATGLRYLGNALKRIGKLADSRQILAESLTLARQPKARSSVLLELGNTERALGSKAIAIGKQEAAQKHTQAAIQFYQQADLVSGGQPQALLNQLSLFVEIGQLAEAGQLWTKIQQLIVSLPASQTAIYARLNLARSLTCLQPGINSDALSCSERSRWSKKPFPETSYTIETPSWRVIAQILVSALQQAQSLQDRKAESYVLGQLGGLYELTGQWSEAQTLTRQALFLVETLQTPDLRYRWEWQLGRLFEKQGDIREAIAAYTRAVVALESIRADLRVVSSEVQFSFLDSVQPLYRGLVNLLLKPEKNAQPSQANLKKAIRNVDAFQIAELENYLGCNLSQIAQLEQVTDPKAAVVYPIILKDRIAIIFELPGYPKSLSYQETRVPQNEVEQTLRALRDNLTLPANTPEVLESAQKVYGWLIKPLEPFLKQSSQVETLVFVLDGELRNVPMAVLYDGEHYLIEKNYAIAIAPRLQLFSPKPSAQKLNVLTGGIGTPQIIDGVTFPEIAQLKEELEGVAQQIKTSRPLLNTNFTKTNIEHQLQSGRFSAVHWKTHGVFSSDSEETYIVAYKERIKAQDLHSIVEIGSRSGAKPLELLVLSACETAQGDDRAVLGLAGIAVRTGTRSALSTLWAAEDAPNTEFMVRFYKELSKPRMTKAQAVRQAQLDLLQESGYTTPHIWANYVLIGNWL